MVYLYEPKCSLLIWCQSHWWKNYFPFQSVASKWSCNISLLRSCSTQLVANSRPESRADLLTKLFLEELKVTPKIPAWSAVGVQCQGVGTAKRNSVYKHLWCDQAEFLCNFKPLAVRQTDTYPTQVVPLTQCTIKREASYKEAIEGVYRPSSCLASVLLD